jgi:hypothetical protein
VSPLMYMNGDELQHWVPLAWISWSVLFLDTK